MMPSNHALQSRMRGSGGSRGRGIAIGASRGRRLPRLRDWVVRRLRVAVENVITEFQIERHESVEASHWFERFDSDGG